MHPLSRIYWIIDSSLPKFLAYSPGWQGTGDAEAQQTLASIVEGQNEFLDKFAEYCESQDIPVIRGQFPIAYTELHDLSVPFLLRKSVEFQRRDVLAIQECLKAIKDETDLAWGEEALGMSRAHEEVLAGLLATPV